MGWDKIENFAFSKQFMLLEVKDVIIFSVLDYLDLPGQLTCRLKGVFHPGLTDMPDGQLTSRLKGVFHPGLADMPDK